MNRCLGGFAASLAGRSLHGGLLLLAIVIVGLPATGLAQQRPTLPVVAVLDLEAVGASKVEAVAVSERLREVLLKTGRFTVADRGQIEAVLNEQALQQTGCTTQECAVQVGRILGVRQLVSGKIVKVGSDLWLVSAQMIDVETAETLAAESLRHQGGLFDILDTLLPRLGAKLAGVPTQPPAVAAALPGPAARAPAPRPPVQPAGNGLRVALFPAQLEGQIKGNDAAVHKLAQVLERRGMALVYSFYPTEDPAPYEALKAHPLHAAIERDSWSGFLLKKPDEDFILRTARSLKVDLVLLYRAIAERGRTSSNRAFTLSVWDARSGRHLSRFSYFEPDTWSASMARAFDELLDDLIPAEAAQR